MSRHVEEEMPAFFTRPSPHPASRAGSHGVEALRYVSAKMAAIRVPSRQKCRGIQSLRHTKS